MAAQLILRDVSLRFGGIKVLQDVSFAVEPGQIFGLVGPNGAGKTSLFNCISGHYRPSGGSIKIDDAEVQRLAPCGARRSRARRARSSIRLCGCTRPCSRTCCSGPHTRLPGGPVEWALRLPRDVARPSGRCAPRRSTCSSGNGLGWAARLPADELSHGLHKGIELCRALLMKPRLLLLDEPAAGLPHTEVEQLIATVARLRTEDDITVVIVEHHMGLIAALTDRVVGARPRAQAHGGQRRRGAVRPPRHRGVHRQGGRR